MNDVNGGTLADARALIDTPDKWVKGSYAFNGRRCIWRALGDAGVSKMDRLPLYEASGTFSLIAWQDAPERTHSEVMALFDKAMESNG